MKDLPRRPTSRSAGRVLASPGRSPRAWSTSGICSSHRSSWGGGNSLSARRRFGSNPRPGGRAAVRQTAWCCCATAPAHLELSPYPPSDTGSSDGVAVAPAGRTRAADGRGPPRPASRPIEDHRQQDEGGESTPGQPPARNAPTRTSRTTSRVTGTPRGRRIVLSICPVIAVPQGVGPGGSRFEQMLLAGNIATGNRTRNAGRTGLA